MEPRLHDLTATQDIKGYASVYCDAESAHSVISPCGAQQTNFRHSSNPGSGAASGRAARFNGAVVFISPLVQAGNKYRVRAEVENRTENGHPLLRPGMSATMTIPLNTAGTTAR